MLWIYNIGIVLYGLLIKLISIFNYKAKLFTKGRKDILKKIQETVNPNDHPIWFHFASLGEFEQGRPVLEELKATTPSQKIVVTFFSPSGYEIRKNYPLASVFYLPLDTAANAKKFIKLVNPKMAIFTKYEFWYHYFNALNAQQIPLYLISGIFRPNQVFFKWYGSFYRNILNAITYFFVQNEESVNLLKGIGIERVKLSGDTRFDRVYAHAKNPKKVATIADFSSNSPVFIAGSTWLEDEKLLVDLVNTSPEWKFIIAPHEIDSQHIESIQKLFGSKATLFSQAETMKQSLESTIDPSSTAQVLIIDNIGMLSSLYQYAKIAYIGGGFGAGIHNTLEAAAFGLPIIFGPKYDKFQEAKDLIEIGSAKSIENSAELLTAFTYFNTNEIAGIEASKYVEKKKGATNMILEVLTNN